jgi:hypothetical protein
MKYQLITNETDPLTITLSAYRMTKFAPNWTNQFFYFDFTL